MNFCDLLDIASIFTTHIFREFLSSIYVERSLKYNADSKFLDLHNFNAENFLFKLIRPVVLESMFHCYAQDKVLKIFSKGVLTCVEQGQNNQI